MAHAEPVRPRLSRSLVSLRFANRFSFTLDAVKTRAPTTRRTDLDFVLGFDMYIRPSSSQGHRVLLQCVFFSLVFAFSRSPHFLFLTTSASPALLVSPWDCCLRRPRCPSLFTSSLQVLLSLVLTLFSLSTESVTGLVTGCQSGPES